MSEDLLKKSFFQLKTLIYNSVFLAASAVIFIKVLDQKISEAGLEFSFRKWLKRSQGLSFMVITSNTSGQKCCYPLFYKLLNRLSVYFMFVKDLEQLSKESEATL